MTLETTLPMTAPSPGAGRGNPPAIPLTSAPAAEEEVEKEEEEKEEEEEEEELGWRCTRRKAAKRVSVSRK